MPFVESRGSKVYFEVHGHEENEPLLCIGGWGLQTGDHFTQLPELLRDHYRVVVYDHRGLGASEPDPENATTAAFADDALAVLEAAGMPNAHVLGQGGLGACVGQLLAIRAPGAVRDLVLTAGWAGPEPMHDFQLLSLLRMRRGFGFEAFRELCKTYTHHAEYVNARPTELSRAWSGPGNIHERDEAHIQLIEANLAHDARDQLKDITCRVLVVCGENDLLGGPRHAHELQTLIPGARSETLWGTPHAFGSVQGAIEKYAAMVHEFFQDSVPA